MNKRELPKLKELPLLLYVIDCKPYILSLNDSFIRKGDNLHKINDLYNIADMNYRFCDKYEEYKKGHIEKEDLISFYTFMICQLESQLINKKEVDSLINNLTDKQFAELEKQVDMFYEIHLLSEIKE